MHPKGSKNALLSFLFIAFLVAAHNIDEYNTEIIKEAYNYPFIAWRQNIIKGTVLQFIFFLKSGHHGAIDL